MLLKSDVIFCNIYLNEEILSWAPSFFSWNYFTCLWRFQQLLANKKAPFECCTFTSRCNEAAENKEKQQQKLRRHNIYFANHISKITDSSDFFLIVEEYTQLLQLHFGY